MKRTIILIVALISFSVVGCNQTAKNQTTVKHYTARVFQSELDQFGYEIYKDSVLIIHQPIIPGVQGNRGFSSKEKAKKVADLMVHKLENGIMPPSVSAKELDSMKALN